MQVFAPRMTSDPPSYPRPDHNALLRLPLQLLLHIVHYLLPSSAGILTLCSKSLWLTLGSRYIEQLEKGTRQMNPRDYGFKVFTADEEQRNTFLLLLERDDNEMVFCYHCQKLHKIHDTNRGPQTKCTYFDPYQTGYGWNGLDYSTLYFGMKYHRKGLNISYMLTPLLRTATYYKCKYTRQMSFTARVVSGNLYLRTQIWFLLPSKQPLELPKSDYAWHLCCHVNVWRDSKCL